MRRFNLSILALMMATLLAVAVNAGSGSGVFKAGYVSVDEEGNLGVNAETYNLYDGFNVSFEDFQYKFDNGIYFNTNLENVSLNNRNLSSSVYKPGLFNLSLYHNQYRRIFNKTGDKYTRRRSTSVDGAFYLTKNLKLYSSASRTDKKGDIYQIYRPVLDTEEYSTDYFQTSFKVGAFGFCPYGSLKAEYRRYDFYDDLDPHNDREANALNFTATAKIPKYDWANFAGGYYHRLDHVYDKESELVTNQYWAGTKLYFANQLKFDYRILYGLSKNRVIKVYTDNWINTFALTKGFKKDASLTVGYETRVADNHIDRTEAGGFIFSGWAKLDKKFLISTKLTTRNKEVKSGTTILGNEDYSRHSVTLKYTGNSWGNLSGKFESRLKKNDDVNSQMDYDSYSATLDLIPRQNCKLAVTYAYYLGKYENFSDETSFEFADNVLSGSFYPQAFGDFKFFATASYYRAHRDKDMEKFNLSLTGQYTLPHDHTLEVKYNISTFDDLKVVDNFYTGNIFEFNFIKGLNL